MRGLPETLLSLSTLLLTRRPWNRTGTAKPEPQEPNRTEPNRTGTEPQVIPGNRTEKRFLSLSLSLSRILSLPLSLALFLCLSHDNSRWETTQNTSLSSPERVPFSGRDGWEASRNTPSWFRARTGQKRRNAEESAPRACWGAHRGGMVGKPRQI